MVSRKSCDKLPELKVVRNRIFDGNSEVNFYLRSAVIIVHRPENTVLIPVVPTGLITTVRDFVAMLARAGKNYAEIQNSMKASYGDQSLEKR